jgi:hypothetical protein
MAQQDNFIAFIRPMYVGDDIRRDTYRMDERYNKDEFRNCTLWLVTSRKNKAEPKDSPRRRVYSLVARLKNCSVEIDKKQSKWRLRLTGGESSEQYASNNANFVLLGLEFEPRKPIEKMRGFGKTLQNTRTLSARDASLLHEFSLELRVRPSVFLSYSREDPRADAIQDALEASGVPLFRDVTSLPFGADWRDEISKAIRQSRVFLYLHSEKSSGSKYVKGEIEEALRIRKASSIKIISVPMRSRDIPDEEPFRTLKDLNLLEWDTMDTKQALESLVGDVHRFLVHEAA